MSKEVNNGIETRSLKQSQELCIENLKSWGDRYISSRDYMAKFNIPKKEWENTWNSLKKRGTIDILIVKGISFAKLIDNDRASK